MAAAELAETIDAPPEAEEIVQLCGRLPLALVMAGKLIVELGVGGHWDGITSILRDELRGEQAASREQAVIRASLAGLKGSERDKAGARKLFKLFGLVPEDTVCPLACLQLMFDAVYATAVDTPILLIRKWLKQLQDRSLVLGTVDQASLHDLVLDFTVAMHSKAELVAAHQSVIEMLRKKRPMIATGKPMWAPENRDDPVTAYVLDECAHHTHKSHDGTHKSRALLLSWTQDIPQDVLVHQTARVLGEDALQAAAEAAEATGEYWAAACHWSAAGHVALLTRGMQASVKGCTRAADALDYVRPSSVPTISKDTLEIDVLIKMISRDGERLLDESLNPRIERLMGSAAGKTDPGSIYPFVYNNLMRAWLPATMAKDPRMMADSAVAVFRSVTRTIAETSDLLQRQFCAILFCGDLGFWIELALLSPDFQFSIFGTDGQYVREGISAYSYQHHHHKIIEIRNGDTFLNGAPYIPLVLRYGDLDVLDSFLEEVSTSVVRAKAEPNQAAEALYRFNRTSECVWVWLLGRTQLFAAYMAVIYNGATWDSIDAVCDAFAADTAVNSFFRPRGQTVPNGFQVSMDYTSWAIKFGAALCRGATAVSAEEFKRTIPSPQQLVAFDLIDGTATLQWQTSVLLMGALTCEERGLDDEALTYIAAIVSPGDITIGGDPKPTSVILAYCAKGRILARRDDLKAAAESFEEAAQKAESLELPLLTMFALRDLKLCVHDRMGHSEHSARRLGAVLRRLTSPVSKLTALLQGLDAAELMALPAPDANYSLDYPCEDSTAADRQEYLGLRLKDLRKLTKEAGISAHELEAAMDDDQPEAKLIDFLLQEKAGAKSHDAALVSASVHQTGLGAAAATTGGVAEGVPPPSVAALRAELQAMRLLPLHTRATSEGSGVTPEQLDAAMDEANPKAAVVRLLLEAAGAASNATEGGGESAAALALRQELDGMRVIALHRRGLSEGIGLAELGGALECATPKQALIELLVAHRAR